MTTSNSTCSVGAGIKRELNRWREPADAGFRDAGWACLAAASFLVPILALGGWVVYRDDARRDAELATIQDRLGAHERLVAGPAKEMLPTDRVAHGKGLFQNACAACHMADGTGVQGLGKNLTKSWFVASLDDAQLVSFVGVGRAADEPLNTTRVPMPPKGGHDELTESDIADIVAYVRGLQDPRRMPALPETAVAAAGPATADEKAKALAAAGGDAELAEYIAHGTKLFASTCAACHGPDARGLKNLGKDLVTSEFCRTLDDDGLLAFVKKGRDPGDPLNTTKVGMPPRGGNPALSDDDLLDIISYVRSLQKQAHPTP